MEAGVVRRSWQHPGETGGLPRGGVKLQRQEGVRVNIKSERPFSEEHGDGGGHEVILGLLV